MASRKEIYVFTLIGLLLGIGLDLLMRNEIKSIFYYIFLLLYSLLFALTFNEKHLLRLLGTSFIVALVLSMPFLPFIVDVPPQHIGHFIAFLAAFPIYVYISHSFHYAYHHDNSWRVNYNSLFAAVWNTIPLLFVALLFSSLANCLILIGAFVFKTVGSTFLWNLYFDNLNFRLISNVTLFFIGLGVGQQNIKVIYNLRFLLLRMMYYLFPFLALISALYFVLYLGHSVSGGPDNINPLTVLLPLNILGIIFFNAYFQDGCIESDAPSWLIFFCEFIGLFYSF